jgi:hypothetical protein
MSDSDPRPYDHFRAGEDGPVPAGVYRVVGSGEGTVALLCLTDETGRRVSTGTVEHVEKEVFETAFEPASNPDAGFSLDLRSRLSAFLSLVRYHLGV